MGARFSGDLLGGGPDRYREGLVPEHWIRAGELALKWPTSAGEAGTGAVSGSSGLTVSGSRAVQPRKVRLKVVRPPLQFFSIGNLEYFFAERLVRLAREHRALPMSSCFLNTRRARGQHDHARLAGTADAKPGCTSGANKALAHVSEPAGISGLHAATIRRKPLPQEESARITFLAAPCGGRAGVDPGKRSRRQRSPQGLFAPTMHSRTMPFRAARELRTEARIAVRLQGLRGVVVQFPPPRERAEVSSPTSRPVHGTSPFTFDRIGPT